MPCLRFLVTRPQPAAGATADRLRRAGHEPVLAPLLATEPVAWRMPARRPQAVMLTSAAAARLAGEVAELQDIPCFTVGAATAAAARAVGWRDVHDGSGDVQALLERVMAAGISDALHLAGADHVAARTPPGLDVATVIVYRAVLQPLMAPPAVDWVLLYSSRTAAHFAAELDRLGLPRADVAIAAISAAALAAAGPGWRRWIAATAPNEDALLAAVGVSCH